MPLLSLDIRMLRSFVSVVQTGSITVTARQLGRTQPAITLQLQRLEELINTTLLRHEGRRQLLTDDGDLVLSYAKSIYSSALRSRSLHGSPLTPLMRRMSTVGCPKARA
jgi:DNA-binding transcriptional LysR family regulator